MKCKICDKEGNEDEIVAGTCEGCNTGMIDASVEYNIKTNKKFLESLGIKEKKSMNKNEKQTTLMSKMIPLMVNEKGKIIYIPFSNEDIMFTTKKGGMSRLLPNIMHFWNNTYIDPKDANVITIMHNNKELVDEQIRQFLSERLK